MPRSFGTSIVLPADPSVAMEAATKQYVDNSLTPYARIQTPTTNQTVNYTATMNQIVMVDASSGSVTITLPLISGAGRISVKKVDTSTNVVNVVPSGSNTIGSMGATTVPVRYQDQTTTFQANGAASPANWVIPYNHLSPSSLAAIYAPLASPTFTGTVTVPAPSNSTDATTKNYVDSADATKAPTASPTFTGTVTVPAPSNSTDATTKNYVDSADATKAGRADVQSFLVAGTFTWTKPAGASSVHIAALSGGGGGASGARAASGTAALGGGGGGGGSLTEVRLPASAFNATETVQVGAGGAGGAGVSSGTTANSGSIGNPSFVGGTVPRKAITYGTPSGTATGGGAGAIAISAVGGAGGAPVASAAGSGGNVGYAAGGGGAGGSMSTTPATVFGGGKGGDCYQLNYNGTSGGTSGSRNGTAPAALGFPAGAPGGGGGAGGGNVAGGNGANGVSYGGGGGGGGATTTSFTSGAGGNGGDGFVIITTYF